jgi:hypothetical protein
MKTHYTGAVYALTQANMQHLISQLEDKTIQIVKLKHALQKYNDLIVDDPMGIGIELTLMQAHKRNVVELLKET